MSKESMIATILTTKCRERRNLGIIQPDKNPDIVFGSDQELRTMPTSTEYKTVQTGILVYAQEIGWTIVTREEAEQRRGSEPQMSQIFTDSESPASHLRKSAKSADKTLLMA